MITFDEQMLNSGQYISGTTTEHWTQYQNVNPDNKLVAIATSEIGLK